MSNCELKISFSTDGYKAYADFIPSVGEGSELTSLYAQTVIFEAGIEIGVDWDIINSTIDYCNNHKKKRINIKIATGVKSISEVPPHWNLKDKFFKSAMGFNDFELKIDYKEQSQFIMVKKGELIADWDEGRPGVVGSSVRNKPLAFKKKKIVQFTNGRNTKEYHGHLYASTSGRYEVSESRDIHINDILHIEGNVDYSTGNIFFGKDVIIDGEIKDGFKVAVGGSLHCKSNLDASDVLCRKDLLVDKGIIGRGKAIVRVGGKITATFIENCHVESKSGITIIKNIMNSQIYTLGHLELGDKSSIVSSHVYSALGIKVRNVGKMGSPNSELSVGASFVDKRSIESINQRINVLKSKFNHLNEMPKHRKTEKKLELIKQIKEVIIKGEKELEKLVNDLYKYPDATVSISGKIYPGNIINICGHKYSLTTENSNVKFYLNPTSQRVESVPL